MTKSLDQYGGFFPPKATPDDHHFGRPDWLCTTCGEPWPCEPARRRLVAETGGGTYLAMACWVYLEEYVMDLMPAGRMDGLFERFVGWTRS